MCVSEREGKRQWTNRERKHKKRLRMAFYDFNKKIVCTFPIVGNNFMYEPVLKLGLTILISGVLVSSHLKSTKVKSVRSH